ncbi:hypothetical protein TRIHO_29000 [Tritonibacter horizontis]|uniref:Uncharacterized protein n=1 Tax=Tritonibacter horizontis TaxID=1768241 RepID=A0A132BW28_9RHOB|nr:hypothetical protein TRIHO_29000 [Tritonibacter horizontis]
MDPTVLVRLAAVDPQLAHRLQIEGARVFDCLAQERQHGFDDRFCVAFFHASAVNHLLHQLFLAQLKHGAC